MYDVAILKIAKLGHPVLLKKTNEINNLNDVNLKNIIYNIPIEINFFDILKYLKSSFRYYK